MNQEKAPERGRNALGGNKENRLGSELTGGKESMFPPVVKPWRMRWPLWMGSAWFRARKGAAP